MPRETLHRCREKQCEIWIQRRPAGAAARTREKGPFNQDQTTGPRNGSAVDSKLRFAKTPEENTKKIPRKHKVAVPKVGRSSVAVELKLRFAKTPVENTKKIPRKHPNSRSRRSVPEGMSSALATCGGEVIDVQRETHTRQKKECGRSVAVYNLKVGVVLPKFRSSAPGPGEATKLAVGRCGPGAKGRLFVAADDCRFDPAFHNFNQRHEPSAAEFLLHQGPEFDVEISGEKLRNRPRQAPCDLITHISLVPNLSPEFEFPSTSEYRGKRLTRSCCRSIKTLTVGLNRRGAGKIETSPSYRECGRQISSTAANQVKGDPTLTGNSFGLELKQDTQEHRFSGGHRHGLHVQKLVYDAVLVVGGLWFGPLNGREEKPNSLEIHIDVEVIRSTARMPSARRILPNEDTEGYSLYPHYLWVKIVWALMNEDGVLNCGEQTRSIYQTVSVHERVFILEYYPPVASRGHLSFPSSTAFKYALTALSEAHCYRLDRAEGLGM
ncbi:hypothetical protein B0H16DRAFT_1761068 [Mycena metata]|uniref:Uncharacterized protein n=1 Tax=Mycena metata TaxID=1033252 RepID=A0AAD7IAM6_9AGAR|nr:hypothetical protein B0H16DRAFT_1761068 [Mycena metata]